MDKSSDNLPRRPKTPVSYAESEESISPHYETPPQQRKFIDLTEDDEEEDEDDMEEEDTKKGGKDYEKDQIQYKIPLGLGLRARKPNKSLKATENGEISRKRVRPPKKKKPRRSAIADLIGADIEGIDLTPVVSSRVAIRREIASKTDAYRDRFLVEKKDFWLPLLPPNNYVRKLVEKHEQLSKEEKSRLPAITPYEEIETQPKGVQATMKPYQLSGLSFMLYLHRNVRISLIIYMARTDNL
jgi:SWI/SNF-related matrix-associated actin-dependent regulator of chromatin subfamily A member 5